MTVKFSGEDDWDAFINHNSMDIAEEDEFLDYCEKNRIPFDLEHLEAAYIAFQKLAENT